MNIIYNKKTGEIIKKIPDDQDYRVFFSLYPKDFRETLASIKIDNPPENLYSYKIKCRELIKMSNQEIFEKRFYGRFLTEEERQLNKLKPSPDEVRKAENTIEILTLIQEVI